MKKRFCDSALDGKNPGHAPEKYIGRNKDLKREMLWTNNAT